MRLLELQRAVQAQVRTPEAIECGRGLAIYREAYSARLLEVLETHFPICRVVDPNNFSLAAREYIATYASHNKSIRFVGAAMPETIRQRGQKLLADLAAFEWLLAHAFDAADRTPIAMEQLSTVEPAVWPLLQFEFHPSVRCIDLHTNSAEIARAYFADATIPPLCSAPAKTFVVWRAGLTSKFRTLDHDEAHALKCALGGESFEQLCESLCEAVDVAEVPARAATLLRTWMDAEMVTDYRVVSSVS